ncbi:reverse transcriptase domain-containing protein [Tanacetum coccineum]
MGEPERLRTIPMEFAVVKSHSPYNVILGRTGLRSLGAVASTIHSMIKFPTVNEIAIVTTKKETLDECLRMEEAQRPVLEGRIAFPQIPALGSEGTTNTSREEIQGQPKEGGEPEDTVQPPPSPPKKDTQIDEKIEGKDKHPERPLESKPPEKVVMHDDYLDQTIAIGGNLSVKCRSELIEILRKHAYAFAWTSADMTRIPCFITEHELKTYPHIKPRVQRKQSIALDRRKIVKDEVAEYIKARIVRKDLYPLPEIDWKIESLMRFKYKCFLNAYKGYHQIKMTKKDEEKRRSIPMKESFCYTKMPFGLKNVRAMYQRLVDAIFEGQMGRNLEAYVDDMVIKSKTKPEMIKDVEETLLTLKKVNMKLNPKKCSFKMEEGKLLGYIVTSEGITVNPEKAKAATGEAEEAFQEIKRLIMELPTLTAPKKEEELLVYLSAANKAVSFVLLVERQGRQAQSIT